MHVTGGQLYICRPWTAAWATCSSWATDCSRSVWARWEGEKKIRRVMARMEHRERKAEIERRERETIKWSRFFLQHYKGKFRNPFKANPAQSRRQKKGHCTFHLLKALWTYVSQSSTPCLCTNWKRNTFESCYSITSVILGIDILTAIVHLF